MRIKYIVAASLLGMLLAGCGGGGTAASGGSGNSGSARSDAGDEAAEVIPTNWYVRLVAEDRVRGMKTESTQLGELDTADTEAYARKAAGTTSESYIDIQFENPEGLEPGEYKALFYPYDANRERSWNFSVVTDDPDAEVTLSWHGLFVLTPKSDAPAHYSEYRSVTNPLTRHMKLVDVENGTEVQAVRDGRIMKYTFRMDGSRSHAFRWVVATSEVKIPLPAVPDKDSASARTASQYKGVRSAAVRKESREVKPRSFDFSKPDMPIFK